MNTQKTIGVLTDTEVLFVGVVKEKRVLRSILLTPGVSDLSGLLERLWHAGLTEVWVMPTTARSRTVTCAWFEQVNSHWVVVVHPDPREPTRPICALLWPKGSGQREERRLAFVFPEHAGWDWVLPDAKCLLATVTYLDQALGWPMIDSPNLVAHRMLTDLTLDQSTSWLPSTPVDLRGLSGSDGTPIPVTESARDLVWVRPLTRVEQQQRYLHKYAHLSRYLEACIGVQLGVGAPQYSSNGRACDDIRPGIWRVSAERAGSLFDGKRLPSCLDGEWMSTPQIKCCRDTGYHVQVWEGYYWQESRELLKRWATTLWQAGERLHTHPQNYRHVLGRTNASHSITLLAELGVTILAQEKTTGGWSRPDWQAQILGRSRATLFAHLAALVRKGMMPVLVDRNSLWVVSNDPNPLTAVPGLVTTRRWRGYTVGYEVPLPLSGEVKETFRTARQAEQVIMALDTLAGDIFP
ncbi:MAG TPA: hypothetical protein VIY29_05315 [Ktedonobacteraceae bacterium]